MSSSGIRDWVRRDGASRLADFFSACIGPAIIKKTIDSFELKIGALIKSSRAVAVSVGHSHTVTVTHASSQSSTGGRFAHVATRTAANICKRYLRSSIRCSTPKGKFPERQFF